MGSASQQYYSLHWSEFGSSLTSAIESLRGDNDLVDVTLAAGGRKFFAHKIVLSAASPFLLDIFKCTPCQHPTVMLDGISANDLASILEFIYRGELSVEQSQLPSLLQAAQCLSIHGLPPSIIMSEKGEEVPLSSLPGCNDPSVARETMNAYLAQRRRKKKRKQEGGGGKWPRSYSIDNRSIDGHSEDNRSLDYGHKDGHEEVKARGEHTNHHIGSPLPQHQLVHPVVEHNVGTALIADPEAEPHQLHNLMPMQPYSPLHIPQFPGAIQSMSYPASAVAAAASVGVVAAANANVSTPSGTSTPHSNTSSTTPSQSSTGAKIRGASDCPGVCPLCGATLRQARNLRRHLLSSCKYRFSANANQHQMQGDSMSIEVKPEVSISGYGSGGAGSQGSAESASSSCEQIVCNPSPLPSPSPQGSSNVVSPHSSISSPTVAR